MVDDIDDVRVLTGQEIRGQGLDGWRNVLDRLIVRFDTDGFSAGATLVQQIARVADEDKHHLEIDLRSSHVTVTLGSHDLAVVTPRDVRLARRISELATEAEATPAEHAPDVIELALDTADHERVKPFYAAMLGYVPVDTVPNDLRDPADRSPNVWFQHSSSTAVDRQRWHLCVKVPDDVVEARIHAVVEAGGRLVDDSAAPEFWVLEDPDGNRSCLCTWQ